MKVLVLSGVYGFAGGTDFLSPQSALQMALPNRDASIGLSIILSAEQSGLAVFVSAAQSTFENRLAGNMRALVPSLNTSTVRVDGFESFEVFGRPG